MSDHTSSSQLESLRVRKERVHTTMLIELLSLLVFLSIAFAFVQKEEGDRTNPWKEKFDQISDELDRTRAEVRELKAEARSLRSTIRVLEEANRLLRASISGPLAANDRRVAIPAEQLIELNQRLANSEALLAERQTENARLRDRLSGRGGTDLPRCAVAPGFLLRVQVSGGDTYRTTANWPTNAASMVAQVPGALQLGAGKSMSRGDFTRYAQQVRDWGRSQSVPCAFTVLVSETHGNLGLYKQQQRLVGRYFYPAYQ